MKYTLLALLLAASAQAAGLDQYNVVWDSPSKDASGSMPVGNGDIGLNVWVQDGDLLFLIGKADAWDENSINCKLARVRVKFSPNPFSDGAPFRQATVLENGEIEITAGAAGSAVTTRLWVDANRPVVHVESRGEKPFSQQVILETWRNAPTTIATEVSDLFHILTKKGKAPEPDPYPTVVFPDVVVSGKPDRLLWYHHNIVPPNDGYQINLDLQGMGSYSQQMAHPLAGRTFGAAIKGDGFTSTDSRTLQSEPATSHSFAVYPLTVPNTTPEAWMAKLDAQISEVEAVPLEEARAAHRAWWSAFWNRSWMKISSRETPDPTGEKATAFEVARAYQLSRYLNACAGRGAQPIKFNGSLFSVGKEGNPDYRLWGGPGFWFQNQRLIYWPMLAQGDYDLMEPWFRMYRENLPFAKERTQKYFHHDGAFFGETIMFWGAEASSHYGWQRPFESRPSPLCECPYVTYYWQGNLEMLAMMLDYYEQTGDTAFATRTLLPHAEEITKFYDLHYKRDAKGKLLFDPAQSLETYQSGVINPLPEIAGLLSQMPRLLALPHSMTTATQRERWKSLLDDTPAVPRGVKEEKEVFLPAERFLPKTRNIENPELYGIFPYRIHGIGKPDLDVARTTYALRNNKNFACWHQDQVQAALLGLTEEAKEGVRSRAAAQRHSTSRFPVFWNAWPDWTPDVDHGGNLQLALQAMAMQIDGEKIRLLPAWPSTWDVSFKLHAPGNTIVECDYSGGKIQRLVVTPESRRRDVILPGAATRAPSKGNAPTGE